MLLTRRTKWRRMPEHHVTVKGTVEGETLKLTSIDMAPRKGHVIPLCFHSL